jgi:hypothetical protein
MANNAPWTASSVIHGTAMSFDGGDKLNGSLYLCVPGAGADPTVANAAITALRAAGLWSMDEPKSVRDDQKSAYEQQLQFVEAVEVGGRFGPLVLARFDHPKFPSSPERFAAWKAALGV